jgi:triosephosphate isomerase (TIM)
MSDKLVVGNWKMNMTPHQAVQFLAHFTKEVSFHRGTQVVICAPYVDLYPMSEVIDKHQIHLGAQDLSPIDEGPHTGDVSGLLLKGLVDYVIVGHSERRAAHGETDQLIASKVAAAVRHGLTPVLCIGDRLNDREDGHANRVVSSQLEVTLSGLTAEEVARVVVCYEPIWAISHGDGRGKAATPDLVAPMLERMHKTLSELYGAETADQVRLIYGGSVNGDNAAAYLEVPRLHGFLPGGASLIYAEFAQIVTLVQQSVLTN